MMRRNYQFSLIIIFTLLFCGCVWEDMTNCDLSLHIKYDYNKDDRDKILEEVDHLELFVFLEDGRLYKRLSIQPKLDGTSINLTLEGGTYHLVAWGNMSAPTTQEGSYLYDANSKKIIYHRKELEFQDSVRGLFYGITESFTIDGKSKYSREMSLVKNTKHIDVVIHGLTDPSCELFADNRNHDNKNTPSVRLDSRARIDHTSEKMIYRFNTHRLLAADSAKSGLTIYDKTTTKSETTAYTSSLISLLLKNPEIYDLDRLDYYLIEIYFNAAYLSPAIKVNGFTVVEMPEEL